MAAKTLTHKEKRKIANARAKEIFEAQPYAKEIATWAYDISADINRALSGRAYGLWDYARLRGHLAKHCRLPHVKKIFSRSR